MTKSDLERFRSALLSLKARLCGQISHLAKEASRTREGDEGATAVSPDPTDQGAEVYEQEFAFSLLENQEQTLGQIDEALTRMDQGKFGRCEECGEVIPHARLDAVPYTRHCVTCARKLQ